MNKEQIVKLRAHLIFALGITVVMMIGTITNISSGQSVAPALWNTIKDVRPFEWVMMILWWYALTFPPQLDRWNNRNGVTLGLGPK